jgi:voltage-gated sodium channel
LSEPDIESRSRRLADRVRVWIEQRWVMNLIMGVIILNAIILGVSTSATIMSSRVGPVIEVLDEVVLGMFVFELSLKLFAYNWRFFRSAWNVFDLLVVSFGLLPQGTGMSSLRGLRAIRALRLLSAIPQMRSVVQALLDSLPGMGAVIIMISIMFYVFGVMATLMYGQHFPDWFGTLDRSLYTLFQVMTLESWSMGIVRPVMEVYPMAWLFFIPFIVVTAFSTLNLFIGLLVNTMQSAVEQDNEAEFERLRELVKMETDMVDRHVGELTEELRAMREQMRELQQMAADRQGRSG